MRKTFGTCCSLFVVTALLSLWCPLTCSAQLRTNHLVLKYKELFEAVSSSDLLNVEQPAPVSSYELLKSYPFLRVRPEQTILKGTKNFSGKGGEQKFEAYLLKTDQGTFKLGYYGPAEFVHFDWEVAAENAEMLFRGIIQGPHKFIVPTEQYNRIKERIEVKYPGSIINRQSAVIAPPRLITQSGRVYSHCEAIVYIKDGIYYDEGRVENSFVKYTVVLGNGFLESKIEVLVRGPYQTDPLYWYGINVMPAPSDEKQRQAMIEEFERMKEFQKFAEDLLGKN